jgi:hypothetical protein
MAQARGCLPSAYLALVATAVRRPTMSSRLVFLSTTCVEAFNRPKVRGLITRYCMLHQMLSGRAPFESFVPLQAALRIASGNRPPRPPSHAAAAIQNVQDALWVIAEDCWRQEANERPTIAAVRARLECTCTQAPSPAVTLPETRHGPVSTTTPPNPTLVSETATEVELSPPTAEVWTTVKPARPILALTATPLDLNVTSGSVAASTPESPTPQSPMPFLVDNRNSPGPRSISAPAVPDNAPRSMRPGVAGRATTIPPIPFTPADVEQASTLVASRPRLPHAPLFAGYHARRSSRW